MEDPMRGLRQAVVALFWLTLAGPATAGVPPVVIAEDYGATW